jgi:segregation and condensation protein B
MRMTEPHESPAESLGQAYRELLQQQTWSLEIDEPGAAGPAAEPVPPAAPVREPTPPPRPAEAAPPQPQHILEALLFVGGAPLTAQRAGEILRGLTPAQFDEAIDALNRAYREQGRPYLLQHEGPGVVLTLRPPYRYLLERLFGGVKEARLSNPAVDVLAIVAYRQPVTRQEIESLRGHESNSLIRQLLRRRLIAVVSRAESSGRDVQYGTTPRFLEIFGLRSLDDLPETEDLQRL